MRTSLKKALGREQQILILVL